MRHRGILGLARMLLFCPILLGMPSIVGAAALSSLTIEGPSEVTENTTTRYRVIAVFSNGMTQDVTRRVSWSGSGEGFRISNGVLTIGAVDGDRTISISATFGRGGDSIDTRITVHVLDSAAALSSLAIQGTSTVTENSSASYTARATFSNGSTQLVTADSVWSENSPYAGINAGVLTTAAVNGNQSVLISASYTSAGITKSASLPVTILDSVVSTGSHAGRFSTYNGTVTCLQCHSGEANAFLQSVHYQWQGDATESVGLSSSRAGKLGGINDFCIYPDINWLGKMTNLDGKQVDGGCARCHSGLGLKPSTTFDQAQRENIDCLFCHAPQYKRTLEKDLNNQFHFVADTANMTVSLTQAAQDISVPTTATCLKCHANSGGGNNFKRGDIEAAHSDPTPDFDVHLASKSRGGAGLSCTSCHTTVSHRIAGRGIDLRERDISNVVSCANCHSSAPHGSSDINKHTARINCNVCHIPEFAKIAPTDMVRDWSAPGDVNPATRLYEPHMTMQSQVNPVYGFFNGNSQFYQFGDPATPQPNGRILMAGPLGSINDVGAKIQAMKRHEGRQPMDPLSKILLPLKIGVFFQTGNVDEAVKQGAAAMNWPLDTYTFAATERFMGIYHEVAPKEQALSCSSCHGGARLNFASLGYTPLSTRNGKALCGSCHSSRSASFERTHSIHVSGRGYDCSTCHTFTKAVG